MNFTPLARKYFIDKARRTDRWATDGDTVQINVLRSLLLRGANSEMGRTHWFRQLTNMSNPYSEFTRRVATRDYEDIRDDVMRMIKGERNVLWRGRCVDYAQSSGTSGGRSKYLPITPDSLQRCHYPGAQDAVCHYLRNNPGSRLFAGKAMILGGSFANELGLERIGVNVGDLSATLINRINPIVNRFRIPDKETALLPDWEQKLPLLIEKASHADITNISGVPSWFLTVLKGIMKHRGTDNISDVWPNLEVFFHGGISFEPYREEYTAITDPAKMHFVETYNASEGFFAVQNDPDDSAMLLTLDNDIFYEFIPVDSADRAPVPIWSLQKDRVYEMLITSSNGLWRYRLGDTVRITSTAPVKIKIAGRTKCYINAFGEELMQDNAERAIGRVCERHNASVANYTAAPVFAKGKKRGRHQWLVEWDKAPADLGQFARDLDDELRKENSDYDAKRNHTIFLDPLELISVPKGLFDRWLSTVGNRKLGGQKKIPRLSNDRHIVDTLLSLLNQQ